MAKPKPIYSRASDYLLLILGPLCSGVAAAGFYTPARITGGGATGIGTILYYLFGLDQGIGMMMINIPLVLFGMKVFGWRYGIKTLVGSVMVSLMTTLVGRLSDYQGFLDTSEPINVLLSAIYGGVLMGGSLGIVFLQGATTGGTDLIARLLKLKLAWLPMGKLLMVIDLVVILAVAAAFGNMYSALYGVVALYLSAKVMDMVLYGLDTAKVAYIISQDPQTIAYRLTRELDRGVTILQGRGAWSGQDKEVLMCAFKQRQIVAMKRMVKEIDPDAFLIVCDAHDVMGEGFRQYQQNDL